MKAFSRGGWKEATKLLVTALYRAGGHEGRNEVAASRPGRPIFGGGERPPPCHTRGRDREVLVEAVMVATAALGYLAVGLGFVVAVWWETRTTGESVDPVACWAALLAWPAVFAVMLRGTGR